MLSPPTAALKLRHNHPADLIDVLIAPLLRPEADRADAGAARHLDDLEDAIPALQVFVATLTLAQLLSHSQGSFRNTGPAQRSVVRKRRETDSCEFAAFPVVADAHNRTCDRGVAQDEADCAASDGPAVGTQLAPNRG